LPEEMIFSTETTYLGRFFTQSYHASWTFLYM